MNTAIQRQADSVSGFSGALATRPSAGCPGSCLTAELLGRLPLVCGICRTLDPAIVPERYEVCRECREADEHIDWSDIDALEKAVMAVTP